MKNLLTTLFLFAFSIVAHAAEKYGYGKLVFIDGTSRIGLVETSFGNDFVRFKSSEDSETEKIASEKIKTIAYLKDDKKTTEVEYDYIKVYLGWGQKRISDYAWYEVVERGIVTLYIRKTTMRGSIYNTTTAGFLDYFVIREGEPAAKMIANISGANNNQTFRAKAPLYFSDYPELAEKIKSKEYKWKDLIPVVREYNKWAESKNK
ncbi:MAG TPA: hypothetical protein VF974_05610 [Patescibacteria group bacterium]